ncbi:hypothetical protein ACJRO7_013790 [Eucalyptus globulus]|uniref:Leucine-rich repeat-containing N-terminal plant-type domain-containing protein n=1 Tax=Eucalyptus globulus TaxID=34317 RepID=A0ABD3KXY4_EUCGL
MGSYCSQVLTLVTLLLILDNSRVCFCNNSTPICIEKERETLLQLQQSLLDPSGLLPSWKGKDCCRWEGVICDAINGHVIKLQLLPQPRKDNTIYHFPMESKLSVSGELNSSLLHLRYLNHLDLSRIDFIHGRIPEFLGSMKQLRYLNLSIANFYGMVPQQLGNLTKLEVLDLHDNTGGLVVKDTLWVSYLRSLKYLDMSGSKIANERVLMQVINILPALSHLRLSSCGLHNFHLFSYHLANSTSVVHLQHLDLSNNLFEGPIQRTLFQNMTSLQHLDLSLNSFNSSIPMLFDKFTSLVHLNLERNAFDNIEGGLFSFLKNNQYLKSLCLSYNQIGEGISTTQGNLSGLIENSLESLEIYSNHLKGALPNWLVYFTNLKHILLFDNFFSGPIPSVIGSLSNLETLHLSINGLNGTIPPSMGRLSSLRSLTLSYNQLAGQIPESLGKLGALQYLNLQNNHLEGMITEIHFSNLSRLKELYIGENDNLSFEVKPSWIPPFQPVIIRMNSCKFGTKFPRWIRTQVEAPEIILANASLFGPLPKWLANLTFSRLDLSYNQITELLPKWSSNLTFSELDLSCNQITGPLPNMSINCSYLDLSHNSISGSLPTDIGVMYQVHTLHLNDNQINGTLPSSLCDMELFDLNLANNKLYASIPDCWKGSLLFLTLSFNKLSGVIPSSLGSLPYLTTLHLNGNHLNGELPRALDYCTNLVILDLGENNFSGSIPTWFDESFSSLLILRLRENRFVGNIPSQLCSLSRLQILDMAMNNLTGTIPHCLGNMSRMINLNQDNPSGSVAIAPLQDIISFGFGDDDPDWDREQVIEILKGRYNEYTKIDLQLVVNLDLSSNFLSGSIPEELSFLSGLHGLNLSHNHLHGNIPIGIGNMMSLESLDLSNNHLSGIIPQGISALIFLAHLNLSQNNLTGKIPKGNQIQTLDDPSIYAGNSLLCGDLLRNKCLSAETPQPQKILHPEDTHEEDKLDRALFYAVVMLGFAIGFWGFFGVLLFKKDWRRAYFNFADQVADKAYVAIVMKVAKLKRLRMSRSS